MSSTTPFLDLAVLQGDGESAGVSTAAPGETGASVVPAGEAGEEGAVETAPSGFFSNPLFMFALMGAAFYFLLIRPGAKQQKERKAMMAGLEKGNRVMTTGGMIGKITKISDTRVTLLVAPEVKIEFSRQAVQGVVETDEELPETPGN